VCFFASSVDRHCQLSTGAWNNGKPLLKTVGVRAGMHTGPRM
jgi:hypothetical protein